MDAISDFTCITSPVINVSSGMLIPTQVQLACLAVQSVGILIKNKYDFSPLDVMELDVLRKLCDLLSDAITDYENSKL